MDCSTPGFPVLHHLLEFVQIHGSIESWCHPTISSSAPPFSFCLWFFLASGSSPVSLLFASGDQSIRASASVFPMNIKDWFPLGLTGLISLLSKRLSRVFSSTSVRKHQFFITQPSLEMALGLWKRKWQPTPLFLPGEFHGQRSLAGYSTWDHKKLDTTERLSYSVFFMVQLSHLYMKKHSFDYLDLHWQWCLCFLICCLGLS